MTAITKWLLLKNSQPMKKVVSSSLICVALLLITMISLIALQRWKTKTITNPGESPLQSDNRIQR